MADSAQQIVGGILLAGPFVVTEAVRPFADTMSPLQAVATIGRVGGIGSPTLNIADTKRDSTTEQRIAEIPVRFLSLMLVVFSQVAISALCSLLQIPISNPSNPTAK